MKPPSLSEIINVMKGVGEVLVPFNFPRTSYSPEDDLAIFKAREAVIDGYSLYIHYQKSDYDTYFIETLQIHNTKTPFIPFQVICKLGRRFLGSSNLSLIELFREHRKIYVWSLFTDKQGNPIPPINETLEKCEYEGFEYSYMQPSQADFF